MKEKYLLDNLLCFTLLMSGYSKIYCMCNLHSFSTQQDFILGYVTNFATRVC